MPVVSRVMRGPKSEEVLRQETLEKINARKARIAAATAKLVEKPISAYSCKTARKVAVPAATEHKSEGTTTANNSETAVPTASQNKDFEGRERTRTAPTVLVPKDTVRPTLPPQINAVSENFPTAKKGALKRVSTPYPSKGMILECKAWKPCAKPPDALGRRHNAAHEQVLMDHVRYNRGINSSNHGSKVTSADWIFHRIPIERPDMFLPAPTATGTKVKMGTPLVKEVIEFERWMRTTMFVEMGGKVC